MTEQMEAPDDRILQEDLEYLATRNDFSGIYHSSLLVTGATGLIGSQLVKLFLCLNRMKNAKITIYIFIRDENKARKIFGAFYEKINIVVGDIKSPPEIADSIDYILHCASETASKIFVEKPVETIDTAFMGTRTMLEFAKVKKVKGFVYLSSMEVFGVTGSQEAKESDYGYVDILNPRSSYSESKRMCECLCACYAAEYNVPVKIARLVQAVGAGIDYNDTRVAAQFARSILKGENIVLKTEGKTRRPCVYTRDAVAGICIVLLKGSAGEAYSVANADTVATIRDTAEMIAEKIADNTIKVIFDINVPAEYAPNLNLNLNLNRIKSLGWRAEIGLEEAYRRMIKSIRERRKIIILE
jgi:nucleoside-diphosphate-sugar epimerase